MGDLGEWIVAKGFKKSPIVQEIAQSGHTASMVVYLKEKLKAVKEGEGEREREREI